MKRIFLFLITNVAVLLVLSVTTRLLGVDRWLYANGINYASLMGFAAIMGFGGAKPQGKPAGKPGGKFDDFEDDIPF